MAEFVVYILYSEKHHKFYRGYTSNLIERFKWHQLRSKKGFTKNYRPWKVVYVEFFTTKTDAVSREKYLKTGAGRSWVSEKLTMD